MRDGKCFRGELVWDKELGKYLRRMDCIDEERDKSDLLRERAATDEIKPVLTPKEIDSMTAQPLSAEEIARAEAVKEDAIISGDHSTAAYIRDWLEDGTPTWSDHAIRHLGEELVYKIMVRPPLEKDVVETVIETERGQFKVTESPDDVYSAFELVHLADHDLKVARLEIEQRRERDLLGLERLR